jgi:hypothetical protein
MRHFTVLILIFSASLAFGQQKNNSIIGKWTGTDDKNQTGGIEFLSNGTAKLIVMEQEMPINEYKVDYSKDPIWIDLIVKNNDQARTLFGLITFIDSTTIKWEVFPVPTDNRPSKFTDNSDTTVILKKQ